MSYPNRPVFTKTVDKDGHVWLIAYANTPSRAVVSLKEFQKNLIVNGNPAIALRLGDSQFGEELIFEVFRKQNDILQRTPKRTNHDLIECYYPKASGLEFFEQTLKYFKANLARKGG